LRKQSSCCRSCNRMSNLVSIGKQNKRDTSKFFRTSYNSYHILRKQYSSSDMAAGNEQRAWLQHHRFTSLNSNNFRLPVSGRGRRLGRAIGLGYQQIQLKLLNAGGRSGTARVLQEPAAAANSESKSEALVTFLIILISIKVSYGNNLIYYQCFIQNYSTEDDCLYCNKYCFILLCIVNNNIEYYYILLTIHYNIRQYRQQHTTMCYNILKCCHFY